MKTVYDSPIGLLELSYTQNGIIGLTVASSNSENDEPNGVSFEAIKQLDEYFAGERTAFDLSLELCGTDFQIDVWNALLKIPYGKAKSYRQIAEEIGRPKAARSVGTACHVNPIMLIVPCHRVIGSNGELTGYAFGVEMKKKLLDHEKKHLQKE